MGSIPTPGAFEYLRPVRPPTRLVVCERPEVFRVRARRIWNSKAIGEASEAAVIYHLTRAGYDLAKPLGDNARYDLILELGERFLRVQVKTGRLRADGAIVFPTCSSQAHRGRGTMDYRGQCELFAVFCPETDETYLVPVQAAGVRSCHLRVRAPANNQARGVRWAADHRVGEVDVRRLLASAADPGTPEPVARPVRRAAP